MRPPNDKFKHKYSHYSELYNVDLSTVKRWVKKGINLDDAEEVESRRRENVTKPHSATVVGNLEAFEELYPEGTDLKDSLERLRIAEALAGADYIKARNANDEALAARRLATHLKLVEARRRAEESQPKVDEANKNSLSVGEVESELNSLFATLRLDLESLGKRIALELVGADEIKIIQIINREAEEIISNLYNAKYLREAQGEE